MTASPQDESYVTHTLSSEAEVARRAAFYELFADSPLPRHEQLQNLGLFANRQSLTRMLMMQELYLQVLDVPGVVMEFGVRWGQNLALLSNLRGIYEPFNYTRKLIGFDTFEGFPSVHALDGDAPEVGVGSFAVSHGYEAYLDEVLRFHEQESPIAHVRKYELVKGDATQTVPDYLARHPETIVSFAYFDLDLYSPTRVCLEALRPYLTKGSVVAFDELNHQQFPGETVAVREALGFENIHLRRSRLVSHCAYLVVE